MQAQIQPTRKARGKKKHVAVGQDGNGSRTYDTATAPSEQTVETWPIVWHRATTESALTPSWGTMGRLRSLMAHSVMQYTTPKTS